MILYHGAYMYVSINYNGQVNK